LEIYDFNPLTLDPGESLMIADEFTDFDPAHIVAVMVSVCIVEPQNPSVINAGDCVVDIGNVVPSNRWFRPKVVAPRFQAQQAAARFFLEFMSLLLEQHFGGLFHGLALSRFGGSDRFA
jgi:hypothetical protein